MPERLNMNFAPTEMQLDWQARARRLARERLAPHADIADSQRVVQREALDHLRREGFLSLAVPEWHGGHWVDHVTYALVMEALGEGDASLTCCLAMHFGCAFHVLSAGNREQKERWLGRIVRDGLMFAVASTDARPDEEAAPGLVHAAPVVAATPARLHAARAYVSELFIEWQAGIGTVITARQWLHGNS